MRTIFLLVGILLTASFSCRMKSDGEKIKYTVSKALKLIKKGNYEEFREIVYLDEQESKNDELLQIKFHEANQYLNKYIHVEIDSVKWYFSEHEQYTGSMIIMIPLFKGFDSTNGFEDVKIEFRVGPPRFVSLYKIHGFDFITKVDAYYRARMHEMGKLKYDTDALTDSLDALIK